MGDAQIAELRNSPGYGPAGIILGAGVWSGLRYAMNKFEIKLGFDTVNTLVALALTGAYIYMWKQGNPHDGELKDTGVAAVDIPLLLAGGFYLSSLYPIKSAAKALYNLLNIAWIISFMVETKGSNVGAIFNFMMESHILTALPLKIMTEMCADECMIQLFRYITIGLYGSTKLIGAGYTIMKLVEKEDAPSHIRALGALVFGLSLVDIVGFIDMIKGIEEPAPSTVRGRSRSRSKRKSRSRSRRRSRSRTPRRSRY